MEGGLPASQSIRYIADRRQRCGETLKLRVGGTGVFVLTLVRDGGGGASVLVAPYIPRKGP